MMKKNILHFLLSNYHALSFTSDYIFGYTFENMVYVSFLHGKEIDNFIKLDKASRGQGYSIRFRKPSKKDIAILMTFQTVAICSVEYFNTLVCESKYNKGEILEKLVTERIAKTEWTKDNLKFTEAGDCEILNKPYQVKFENATFINEKTLDNLLKSQTTC